MDFFSFNRALQNHVSRLFAGSDKLFITDVDKDVLWNTYLDAFAPEDNQIYRERREYDCGCCRSFIKEFGAVVVVQAGKVHTIWDFVGEDQFAPVTRALAEYVRSRPIRDLYLPRTAVIGTPTTKEGPLTWHHFHVTVPPKFSRSRRDDPGTVLSEARTTRQVFQRSLEELTIESIQITLELIGQGSLYRGDEVKGALEHFLRLQTAYKELPDADRDAFCWATTAPESVTRIRNRAIGTLLIDLSAGVDVDEAVRKYEAVVAPANYRRPKPVFTQRMLDDAQKTIETLGFLGSLPRRFAHVEDVPASVAVFVNPDARTPPQESGIFTDLAAQVKTTPKQFSRAEEISLDRFLSEVIPTVSQVEVLFESKHRNRLVSLIAPADPNAPSMFRWANGFSWAYKDNVADSMKTRVKDAGGNVDGVLRFSIQWNEDGKSIVDLDAHCVVRRNGYAGERIYFGNKTPANVGGGFLDVDMISPRGIGVENISWEKQPPVGTYRFSVNNFSGHRNHDGFDAEIEYQGTVYTARHRTPFIGRVDVAELKINADGTHEFTWELPSVEGPRRSHTVWGLPTEQFHQVELISTSPNHWEENGTGNKHLFFFLAGCVSDETPNGFFNEFLHPDLEKHRRVFEALGARMRVNPDPSQLSGLGFSSTQRDHLIVRVTGKTTRTLKISL